jgi:tetratricopeptide (TPR) repeat protein
MPVRFVALLMSAVLSWSLSPHAFAREVSALSDAQIEKATKMQAKANALYKSQEYEKALKIYQDIYDLTSDALTLINIGNSQRALGRQKEALQTYRLYLEVAPDSPKKEQIEKKIKDLEPLIEKQIAELQSVLPTSQPTSTPVEIAKTQPTETITQNVFSSYETKEMSSAFNELDDLIRQSEEELAKVKRRLRLVWPAGIGLAAGGFGLAAILLHANIENSGLVNNKIQAQQITFATVSDLAFLAAGVTLYRAISMNKKESSFQVGVAPTLGGAVMSLSFDNLPIFSHSAR